MNEITERKAMNFLNKMWSEMVGDSASYRYYSNRDSINKARAKDQYFYTVQRVNEKGRRGFGSGVYRANLSKGTLKRMRFTIHVKKKDAIARAKRLSKQQA